MAATATIEGGDRLGIPRRNGDDNHLVEVVTLHGFEVRARMSDEPTVGSAGWSLEVDAEHRAYRVRPFREIQMREHRYLGVDIFSSIQPFCSRDGKPD